MLRRRGWKNARGCEDDGHVSLDGGGGNVGNTTELSSTISIVRHVVGISIGVTHMAGAGKMIVLFNLMNLAFHVCVIRNGVGTMFVRTGTSSESGLVVRR